ncbi:MAG: DUF389 domain-containing protein [Alphaproteobacteria bacterium]|nr:DUF389 domain-containing protein [Alphaproteobacteria bacterium]
MKVISLFNKSSIAFINKLSKDINHKEVVESVMKDSVLSWRFAFFIIISAGIATLGLLSNSPSVIIGAMLISPLMGSIVSQGFALATLNINLFKTSTICMSAGALLGILTSFVIVSLSPLFAITPEIIARTNPNLFDLLVAILSAMAAGYSFINQRESSIVGVSIATSLMPPLCVTGFGLAIGNMGVAKGSFFLFMTNLVAICIAIFLFSKLYGFKKRGDKPIRPLDWILGASALLILAIPLSVSLKNISHQSYIIKTCKKEIDFYFKDETYNLNNFTVSFEGSKINIKAVVGVKYYKSNAERDISEKINNKINKEMSLSITQVALAKEKKYGNKIHVLGNNDNNDALGSP